MNPNDMRELAEALTAHHRPPVEPTLKPEPPSAPVIDGQAKTPDTSLSGAELDARNAADQLFGIHHHTPNPGNFA